MSGPDHAEISSLPEIERLPVKRLPIDSLVIAGSPRSSGENPEHARTMAESGAQLPPILVHHATMRVLDGIHRVRVARLRGERDIDARIYDGDEASSFVLAVQANIAHGLPLSLPDRKAAASRIAQAYPHWSDRKIGSVAGLAHGTVASIRERPTGQNGQLDKTRPTLGRDGRTRPRDSAKRRQDAANLFAENPGASAREVARATGLSPTTASDVRRRLVKGHGPAPSSHPPDSADGPAARLAGQTHPNGTSSLAALRADPAFRSTENGRLLLRMLSTCQVIEEKGRPLIDSAPVHCLNWVAAAARSCARTWQDLANRAEERIRESSGQA